MKLHAIIAAAGVAIVVTACDGLWISAGGDVDPSDYYNGYYDGYYQNPYLVVPPLTAGWTDTWGGPGWNPPPYVNHVRPVVPPNGGGGGSVGLPNGPQHWIPPMSGNVNVSAPSGQRPGAGRH